MLALTTPATFGDLLDHNRRRAVRHLPPLKYKRLLALVAGGEAVAARDAAGGVIAIGGLYTHPDGHHREGWIWIEADPGRHLVAVVKAARRVIAGSTLPVIVRTQDGNGRGERLVRLLGFVPTGEVIEGAAVWRLDHESCERAVRRRDDEIAEGSHGEAGGDAGRGAAQGRGG